MSFLDIENKTFLVFGVANKKSVAYHIGKLLESEGARVIYSVRSERRKETVKTLLDPATVFVCDVERQDEIDRLYEEVSAKTEKLHGIVHSIAFANYCKGMKPFHETPREDFMQSVDVSCFSLISISKAFKPLLDLKASIVTISISTTRMAAENYGYMAPVKAALNSAVCFLAKSFSAFSEIRFNTVNPGLLKTSASAGIPGYIDSYLYAESTTLRKRAVATKEVASAVVFLLSECSSGINAQGIVLDAGMSINYFGALRSSKTDFKEKG
tara:strand:+ start:2328 stop:3137 length:810 start_codon:yes stop_codon:yes gene_type:complete